MGEIKFFGEIGVEYALREQPKCFYWCLERDVFEMLGDDLGFNFREELLGRNGGTGSLVGWETPGDDCDPWL